MEAEVLAERIAGRCTLQAVLGDMTSEKVDAIVNAANSNLAHLGGLAGAIVYRGVFGLDTAFHGFRHHDRRAFCGRTRMRKATPI